MIFIKKNKNQKLHQEERNLLLRNTIVMMMKNLFNVFLIFLEDYQVK